MTNNDTLARRNIIQTALLACLVAGTLDITGAIVTSAMHGVPALRIVQSVASGLLGKDAYTGGFSTAALGLALHFCMMLAFAFAFIWAYGRSVFIRTHAVWLGVVYGVAVYAWMNAVVLPLSAFPHHMKYDPAFLATGILTHILCVGLPIALVTKKYFKYNTLAN
ncbi:MAG: DUF1440 domain-containing protein [Pseudomonadota bacterium]